MHCPRSSRKLRILVDPPVTASFDRSYHFKSSRLFNYAPFVLASLLWAGGAAAAMSTANSQIHAMSAA